LKDRIHSKYAHRAARDSRRKRAGRGLGDREIEMTTFTLVHVAISLVGIASGFVVVFGLFAAKPLNGWTAFFLASTVATSVTGFGFPFDHVLPSHVVGVISLLLLSAAIFGRYARHLAGSWRWIYVVSAVVALYLNVFVLVVQLFQKVPALRAMAPTQSEPPFLVTQLLVMALFVAFTIFAVMRFRIDPMLRAQPIKP
jgi:ABC-type multidrug transport system permease subunit